MASKPAGKKPAPIKKTSPKPAAAEKERAGLVTSKAKAPAAKKTPTQRGSVKKESVPTMLGLALTPKQQAFVNEYLVDMNGTQAAIRAGYSARSATEQAYDLLRKPQVWAAITAARKAQMERTQVDADRVVREAWNIATADPRELVQVKIGCCRHCWGEGHRRQRTLSEYNSARELHRSKGEPDDTWEEEGGIGYDPLRDPHPGCPECHGDGYPRTVLGDTRKLSPQALALYAGAKETKYGIEILFHSKLDAMEKLAKHLGLYEKDNQQKTDPLASLLHAIAAGSSNAFRPVADDPEKPPTKAAPSAFTPIQDPRDEE